MSEENPTSAPRWATALLRRPGRRAAARWPLPGYPGERLPSVLAIAAFIAVIGLLACGIPVRRALRIEPAEAVRES